MTTKGGDNAKEVIKTIAKDLEESNVLQSLSDDSGPKVVAAAMVFSYLDPVQKLVNKKI